MPVPTRDKVVELLREPVRYAGYDLEDVEVTQAGKKSIVRVIVDSDAGLALDAVVTLRRSVSELLDAEKSFGEAPYTLEVTSPGVSRPLTEPRHWRRAQGRKVEVELAGGEAGDETIIARIGRLHAVVSGDGDGSGDGEGVGPEVDLVLAGRSAKVGPEVRVVALGDVANAVVQVEFGRVDPRELELAGGVAAGRETLGSVDLDATAEADAIEDKDGLADTGEAAEENDK